VEPRLADAVEAEVVPGLGEADLVRPALVVGVAELDVVVLPEADLADGVGPGGCFFEREKVAARTREATTEPSWVAREFADRAAKPGRVVVGGDIEKVDKDVSEVSAGHGRYSAPAIWTTQPTVWPSRVASSRRPSGSVVVCSVMVSAATECRGRR
jgi:hypothetical protein